MLSKELQHTVHLSSSPCQPKRLPLQIVIAAFQSEDAVDAIEKAIAEAELDTKQVICTNLAKAKKSRGRDHDREGAWQSLRPGKCRGRCGHRRPPRRCQHDPARSLGVMAGASAGGTTGAALAGYGASQIEGMDKDKLNTFGNALEPGCSGIVLVFDEVVVSKDEFDEALTEYKESTDALLEQMSGKISENLKAGNDIAYHLAFTEEGLVGTRTIIGSDAAKVAEIILTPEGFAGAQVTATDTSIRMEATQVTPDAMAAARARLTSSVCAYKVAAVTADEAVYEAGVAAIEKKTE